MSSTCSAVLPTQPLGATAEERQEAEEVEDRLASPASLWLPRTVVKRHRIKATIIWVSLILAFLAYIAYIVWDAVESRMDPATSFELKRELFTFPDISVCVSPYEGCLNIDPSACFENASFVMFSQWGFMEDELEADEASLAIEEAYPHCKVLPTSKLTVNQTGVDNGDINYFFATFGLLWDEDPYDDFDPAVELATTGRTIYTQFVNLFFVDVDLGVEAIGEELTDAKLPYDRLSPNTSGLMAATTSHMVIQLTQFQPISTSSGEKQEPQRTFTQSSTSTTVNWYNPDFDEELAALMFNMFIPKFEYTSIEQVDPVDGWAIIGAIGGVWQFVVIAFGLFFVFSEKQLPDKKIRNFKKSVAKPASIVTRHLSSASSRDPTIQDIEIDTSNEDLPIGWVKRQRKDGTTYYYNPLTGDTRENSPNEAHAVVAVGVAPTAKRRSIARALRIQSPLPFAFVCSPVFPPVGLLTSHAWSSGTCACRSLCNFRVRTMVLVLWWCLVPEGGPQSRNLGEFFCQPNG
ncbi:unnamed protein product [Ectocarpus fasciculatus]